MIMIIVYVIMVMMTVMMAG